MSGKAEDEGGLAPGEDDNEAGRRIDCKDESGFGLVDYAFAAAKVGPRQGVPLSDRVI